MPAPIQVRELTREEQTLVVACGLLIVSSRLPRAKRKCGLPCGLRSSHVLPVAVSGTVGYQSGSP